MPEIVINWSEGEPNDAMEASILLQSVMFFPNDQAKRYSFEEAYLAKATKMLIADASDDVIEGIPPQLLRLAVTPDIDKIWDEASTWVVRSAEKTGRENGIHAGDIAALMILIPFVIAHKTQRRVGRRAAMRVLQHWFDDNGGLLGQSDRSLQAIWTRFQPVGHFWAAKYLLDCLPHADSEQDFMICIALAETIRDWGESYKPMRSANALIDDRVTWKIVSNFAIPEVKVDMGYIDLPSEWLTVALSCDD